MSLLGFFLLQFSCCIPCLLSQGFPFFPVCFSGVKVVVSCPSVMCLVPFLIALSSVFFDCLCQLLSFFLSAGVVSLAASMMAWLNVVHCCPSAVSGSSSSFFLSFSLCHVTWFKWNGAIGRSFKKGCTQPLHQLPHVHCSPLVHTCVNDTEIIDFERGARRKTDALWLPFCHVHCIHPCLMTLCVLCAHGPHTFLCCWQLLLSHVNSLLVCHWHCFFPHFGIWCTIHHCCPFSLPILLTPFGCENSLVGIITSFLAIASSLCVTEFFKCSECENCQCSTKRNVLFARKCRGCVVSRLGARVASTPGLHTPFSNGFECGYLAREGRSVASASLFVWSCMANTERSWRVTNKRAPSAMWGAIR